jgi:hypothetical protein
MDTVEIEVWVVIDETGDYGVGRDAECAGQSYADDIGGGDELAKRQVKVTLRVPKPKPVELVGTVPAESDAGGVLRVA